MFRSIALAAACHCTRRPSDLIRFSLIMLSMMLPHRVRCTANATVLVLRVEQTRFGLDFLDLQFVMIALSLDDADQMQ
jgi:hypothetical protein